MLFIAHLFTFTPSADMLLLFCFYLCMPPRPPTDLKPKIKQIVKKKKKKWQQLWDENPHNKLFQIQPILKERKLDPDNTRREETTLTRLRNGHTRLTHSFILKEEPP